MLSQGRETRVQAFVPGFLALPPHLRQPPPQDAKLQSSKGSSNRSQEAVRYGSGRYLGLDYFQPDCAGRKWSISLFDRMIHAPGTFRSARSCSKVQLKGALMIRIDRVTTRGGDTGET